MWPPFFFMGVKVIKLDDDLNDIRIRLPLNTLSRNPGGVMFGGYQASLADPIAAIVCARKFPNYSAWTRAMTIDFEAGGSEDLELRFQFPPEMESKIRDELEKKGRATQTFHYGYYLSDGSRCTRISNTVAIRRKGYLRATSPPADTAGVD
eukprot:TRINITY_DN5254_c0_g1_i2.p1 TRINITY_DN5254_c0_g1~~TRINITY_DN5254_c0_g1_i2.p1  ORF type:complete len:151 (+),score=40.90 TRINITY_DN5254_c0_g1_i2:279-731(+)